MSFCYISAYPFKHILLTKVQKQYTEQCLELNGKTEDWI